MLFLTSGINHLPSLLSHITHAYRQISFFSVSRLPSSVFLICHPSSQTPLSTISISFVEY